MASSINASTSGAGGVITTADNSGILNLQSNGTTVATVSSTGFSTPANQTINTANTFGFKNRIINGAMMIDQRNAGASQSWGSTTVAGNYYGYSVDRWQIQSYTTTAGSGVAFTTQQNAGSVTPPAGYINYLGATVTTSKASLSATTVTRFYQRIEGFNIADLGWGTANAKTITLSAWVRSSLTGTFGGTLVNNAGNRCYVFSYSIPVANTWTQISVTIPGDTSGTWLTTNAIGIAVSFSLGSDSASLTTAGSWGSTEYYGATGQTNVVSTTGATFYLTGVQLEVGSQATSFDFRDYGRELILCQRYYTNNMLFNGFAEAPTTFCINATFPVAMRATPTMSLSGAIVIYDGGANYGQSSAAVGTASGNNRSVMLFSIGNFSGLTQYRPGNMNPVSGTGTYIASSEL